MLVMMYLVHCICPEFLLWVYFSMSDLNFSDTKSIATQCEKKIEKACCRQVCVLCQIPNSGYFPRILDIRCFIRRPTFISLKNVHFPQRKFQKKQTHTEFIQKSKCAKHCIGLSMIFF